jgi:hypothetical protein
VNSEGALLVLGEAVRRIPASGGGRFVHITPTVVSTTLPGYVAYSLNKAAVETSTKILAKEFAEEKTEQASQATGEAKESAKETKDTVAAKADIAAYQTKETAQNLKEVGVVKLQVDVGVLKLQVDVTSINDSINPNVGARGASNPFATFFNNVNLVLEALASIDAQEATPAAEQVSAEQEAPMVEEAVLVEGTAAAEELAAVEGFLQRQLGTTAIM